MSRTYRVKRSTVVGLAVWTAVWIGAAILGALAEPPDSLFLLLIALVPLGFLFVAFEVTLADNGDCEFRSVVRRRRIRAQRITAISADEGVILVHHDRGKIQMWETADFDGFLSRLLVLNPSLDLSKIEHDAVPTA